MFDLEIIGVFDVRTFKKGVPFIALLVAHVYGNKV